MSRPPYNATSSTTSSTAQTSRRCPVTDTTDTPHEHSNGVSAAASSLHAPLLCWPVVPASLLPSVSSLASPHFNALDLDEDQLLVCVMRTLDHLNLVTPLNLSLPHLQRFLLSVRAQYRVNPYHCWHHGFHVYQFGFYMLTQSRLVTLLTPFDQLALLIACLSHDVDHPGTTNSFQIAIDSSVARVHNELAVLENHHAFITCEMLRHPQTNFMQSFSALHFRRFRKLLVAAILATDMAIHFDLCRQFARLDDDLAQYQPDKEEDRQLVINLVIHSSDLSGQVMNWPIAQLWEARVTAEFIAQSDMETGVGPTTVAFHARHARPYKAAAQPSQLPPLRYAAAVDRRSHRTANHAAVRAAAQ